MIEKRKRGRGGILPAVLPNNLELGVEPLNDPAFRLYVRQPPYRIRQQRPKLTRPPIEERACAARTQSMFSLESLDTAFL